MRAFQSQDQKTGFFPDRFGTFDFWTFLKMSKIGFPPSNPEKYFSSFLILVSPMTFKARKVTDIFNAISLVKNPETGLYREPSEEEKQGKINSGGKKKRKKNKTQKKKKKRGGGGNLVQATEEQKVSDSKTKKRTFKMRKANEPVLLTGDLSNLPSLAQKAPLIVPPQVPPIAEKQLEKKMQNKLPAPANAIPAPANAIPAPANARPAPANAGLIKRTAQAKSETKTAENAVQPSNATEPFDPAANSPGQSVIGTNSQPLPDIARQELTPPPASAAQALAPPPALAPQPASAPPPASTEQALAPPQASAAQASTEPGKKNPSRLLRLNPADQNTLIKKRRKIEGSNVAALAAKYDLDRGKAPTEAIQEKLKKEGKLTNEITSNNLSEYRRIGGKNRTMKKKKKKTVKIKKRTKYGISSKIPQKRLRRFLNV